MEVQTDASFASGSVLGFRWHRSVKVSNWRLVGHCGWTARIEKRVSKRVFASFSAPNIAEASQYRQCTRRISHGVNGVY